jgi:hypothetical protein
MIVPSGVLKQAEIAAEVEAVHQRLGKDVVKINYDFGPDWSGDWAIFFRVLLSNRVGRGDKLHEVSKLVESLLFERIPFFELGLLPYFNYRTTSEQGRLREAGWD